MQLNYYLCSDFLLQVNNKMIIFWEFNNPYKGGVTMKSLKQSLLASILALVPFFAGNALAQSVSAEPTLWGIYGAHNRRDLSAQK